MGTMTEKYKVVKDITLAAIHLAGDDSCKQFRTEYEKFMDWCGTYIVALFYDPIPPEWVLSTIASHPRWAKFLLKHGFIEKIEETTTYNYGQEFEWDNGRTVARYILAQVDPAKVCLINISNGDKGNRYADPVIVKKISEITEAEFDQITGPTDSSEFKRVD